jgi:hypothetical protein
VPVAHACNPSYSGSRSGGSWFEASLSKQFSRPYLEKKRKKITHTTKLHQTQVPPKKKKKRKRKKKKKEKKLKRAS